MFHSKLYTDNDIVILLTLYKTGDAISALLNYVTMSIRSTSFNSTIT